jgi:hypothetical protein
MFTELTWGRLRGAQKAVHAAREHWRLSGRGCATLDPGKNGALAIQAVNKPCLLHPLGDERRGGLAVGVTLCREARVSVLVVEAQYAPSAAPYLTPQMIAAKAASSMVAARQAGLFTGLLAGCMGGGLLVVYAHPPVWQSHSLASEIERLGFSAQPKREDLKAASVAIANRRVGAQMKLIPRADDREGAADAHGILDWWLTSPMGEKPRT